MRTAARQLCIVHMVRYSLNFVGWKLRNKTVAANLREGFFQPSFNPLVDAGFKVPLRFAAPRFAVAHLLQHQRAFPFESRTRSPSVPGGWSLAQP